MLLLKDIEKIESQIRKLENLHLLTNEDSQRVNILSKEFEKCKTQGSFGFNTTLYRIQKDLEKISVKYF